MGHTAWGEGTYCTPTTSIYRPQAGLVSEAGLIHQALPSGYPEGKFRKRRLFIFNQHFIWGERCAVRWADAVGRRVWITACVQRLTRSPVKEINIISTQTNHRAVLTGVT